MIRAASLRPNSRSFSRRAGSGFRLRTPALPLSGIAHARKTSQVVKDRYCKPFTPGGSAGVDKPAQVRVAPSLISESHRNRLESMSCCRIAVELLSSCCHFLLNGKQDEGTFTICPSLTSGDSSFDHFITVLRAITLGFDCACTPQKKCRESLPDLG